MKIVLASQSPRRRELLTQAGFEFRVQSVKVSEIIEQNLNPARVASHLATQKAEACFEAYNYKNLQGFLILGADTVVAVGDQILGKPETKEEAVHFLDLLSGRSHQVITGFCLIESGSGQKHVHWDETLVQFKKLSQEEIQSYVNSDEPYDKAGGYGIQGTAQNFVTGIQGSWTNVVGLPMEKMEEVIREEAWDVDRIPVGKP
ncbi:MAG TPA: septum formation protein Maf [Bdellovibrionales bacterium]|nr:septum formation protein Maf [Pseudobdellovibrionaceae bacterium]HAG92159.1 septum formation protein Maf [Bdellovibrionales bacterium]|tara:strand:+ start:625 stop:1233 length:609 start_codon:yes stop_codon:yes gene_type:complete